MKSQLIRIATIIILGMLLYINMYDEDSEGLIIIVAYLSLFAFTFFIGIPIVFIRNKISIWKKIGVYILSFVITMTIPFLGIGKLKIDIENGLIERQVTKAESKYNVDLPADSVFIGFDNYLLVEQEIEKEDGNGEISIDTIFSVYDSSGKEIKRMSDIELAKEAVPYLPFTEKQKETTYFDYVDTKKNDYHLFSKTTSNDIQLNFRYTTNKEPKGFKPDYEIPKGATDILYHEIIYYTPTLDENGDFVFSKETFKKQPDRVSFVSKRLEVPPPGGDLLIKDLK